MNLRTPFWASALVLGALTFPGLAVSGPTLPTALQQLEASRVMYDTGVADRDVLMVVAAAKLRKKLNLRRANRIPEGETTSDGGFVSASHMLATARVLAEDDPDMIELINLARVDKVKGVQSGPVYNTAIIANQKVDKYPPVPFIGGDYAEIYIEGRGSSDLDLFVYDSLGRLVCSDTDASSRPYCGWVPDKTQNYVIQVINKGNGTNYALVTN